MFLMSSQVKNPVSANYETKKHQYFSVVSLPTDSVIVDHVVAIARSNKILGWGGVGNRRLLS
jgi:hypothetical protein